MSIIRKSVQLDNGPILELEHGVIAKQADGSVILRNGDTMLFASVVASKDSDPESPFLPLSVDYQEKYASSGKIPGGFLKREGRQNEYEILTSRVVDRSIRPLFPDDYKAQIQVIIYLISNGDETRADALAGVAAGAALATSDLPFPDLIATVRVGKKDGQFVINPPRSEMDDLEMDLIVAGTAENVVMVEGECKEVSEEEMVEALKLAHDNIKRIVESLNAMRSEVGKPTREYTKPEHHEALYNRVKELTEAKIDEVAHNHSLDKKGRGESLSAIKDEMMETLKEEDPELEEKGLDFWAKEYFGEVKYNTIRRMILEDGVRLDGRDYNTIRPLDLHVDYVPRAHGSSVFTRGETQAMATVTLGTRLDEQIIDYASEEGSKRFMLQYRFPPFSVGEVKPLRGPARREVGHGNLAERALKNVLPEDYDYVVRVASDVMESNGSSSMATVCAGSMALLDCGVPLKAAVSGIAMGLIVDENGKYAILTDILGDEDHLGDMDFKVTGSRNGITACQMDIKVDGLSYELMSEALNAAKTARLELLDKMNNVIAEPREELKPHVPRMIRVEIPGEMIGAVIGPGGKVVQEMQKTTGATITIDEVDDKGIVTISSPDKDSVEAAREQIERITEVPEVGKTYTGKVVNIRDSGAFVEFLPGKDGYLHIGDIAWERIPTVDSVLSKGQEIEVQYAGIDSRNGKHRLNRKVLLEKPEGFVEERRGPRGGGRRDDRRGGGRRDDRRNNNRND